ncbi:MAG: hypothetical protein ACEQSD_01775 [Flavobacteriales bacterium]
MQHNLDDPSARTAVYLLPDSGKVYNKFTLELYDLVILRLSSTLVWRCPTAQLVLVYSHYLSRRHLEVGVGTGYLLQHGVFPSHSVTLLLADCSTTVVRHALRRLVRYQPKAVVFDLMQADWPDLPKQQSIGINYVWHGLQGTPEQRGALLGRLANLLTDDGVLFGATVRGIHPQMSRLATYASRRWLTAGLFNNQYDTPELLADYLRRYFTEVEVWLRGEVILFIAKHPKRL